jgi:photosystem II stability/assembly factor-like uncharacterized protein
MLPEQRKLMRIRMAVLFAALLVIALCSLAQSLNDNSLKGMKWRLVGPFRGGRVLAVTGVPGDANTFYFGAVAGGVWKTTDGGDSWRPIADQARIVSVGAIAVAPSDPNVIYVGTGEACIRGDITYGDGVYKSTDAGKTWASVGLADTRHIGRVLVDPRNPDIVFVAALGHAFGPNSERGVFRSADGGKSWQKVLFKDDKTGAIDISFDPTNSRILFAALWEASRSPWGMTSGGPGSGLYRSADGGLTWKQLQGNGLPSGVLGRIGVSVGADGNRVYAIIEAEQGGIYASSDAGEHWQRVNDDHRFIQRSWYFNHIIADPKSPDTVYVLNTSFSRSTDGGRTFSNISGMHGDHHGLWIDPTNPQRMINSNDGGADITQDGGRTWSTQGNQPTAEFYHVLADNRFPYMIYGAQQDNSTVAIASRSDHGVINTSDWYSVGGGESGHVVPDPRNPDIVYAGSYDGLITRYDKRTGQSQDINPWPLNPMGHGAADLVHRFQWTAPIAASPNEPGTFYHGAEVLFKTSDGGLSWTAISKDLTRNDKSKQQPSGGPLNQDNTSVEYYCTIFAIAEAPGDKGVIWVGSDDGLVHVTRDGGATWTNVTPRDMPEWGTVSLIDPSPRTPGTAYVAVDRHRLDDFRPYIFKTTDYGKSWSRIVNGLPANAFVHAVREDPKRKGLLFAGTESGVFVSFDDGARWQSLQLNLPVSPVHDLIVKDNDLVVATHGRAFWILDDIAPLRAFDDKVSDADVFVYPPAPALRFRGGGGFGGGGGTAVGVNPPSGLILDYSLKAAPAQPASLEILDAQGKVVRRISSRRPAPAGEAPAEGGFGGRGGGAAVLPVEAGHNRFVWDLRYEPPTAVPGAVYWGGRGAGPLAPPGKYTARLNVAGKLYTTEFEVNPDPRLSVSQDDYQKQFDFMLVLRAELSATHDAINQIRGLRAQIEALRRRLAGNPQAREVLAAADALNKKMTPIEDALIQSKSKSNEDPLNYPIMLGNQLADLMSTVDSADSAPPQQTRAVFDYLKPKIEAQLAAWREIQEKDLAALNDLMKKDNIPVISVPPAGGGPGGGRGGPGD